MNYPMRSPYRRLRPWEDEEEQEQQRPSGRDRLDAMRQDIAEGSFQVPEPETDTRLQRLRKDAIEGTFQVPEPRDSITTQDRAPWQRGVDRAREILSLPTQPGQRMPAIGDSPRTSGRTRGVVSPPTEVPVPEARTAEPPPRSAPGRGYEPPKPVAPEPEREWDRLIGEPTKFADTIPSIPEPVRTTPDEPEDVRREEAELPSTAPEPEVEEREPDSVRVPRARGLEVTPDTAAQVRERMARLAEQREGLEGLSGGEMLAHALGMVPVGAAESYASTLDGIAVTAKEVDSMLPEWIQSYGEEGAEELATARMAGSLRDFVNANPMLSENEELRDHLLLSQLPAALGSFTSFFTGGKASDLIVSGMKKAAQAVARGAGRRAASGGAGSAAANVVSRGAERVARELPDNVAGLTAASMATAGGVGGQYREARAAGVSEEEAREAGLASAPGGLIQVMGPVSALRRFGRLRSGAMAGTSRAGRAARAGAAGVAEEAGAEAAGQAWYNAVAQQTWDPDRGLLDNVVQAGLVGGLAGGTFGSVMGAVTPQNIPAGTSESLKQEAHEMRQMLDKDADVDGRPLTEYGRNLLEAEVAATEYAANWTKAGEELARADALVQEAYAEDGTPIDTRRAQRIREEVEPLRDRFRTLFDEGNPNNLREQPDTALADANDRAELTAAELRQRINQALGEGDQRAPASPEARARGITTGEAEVAAPEPVATEGTVDPVAEPTTEPAAEVAPEPVFPGEGQKQRVPLGRRMREGAAGLIDPEGRDRRNELERQQRTDQLTGLGSESAFRAAREGVDSDPEWEWVYIDANNLKALNDNLGHDVGDAYLQEISEAIRSASTRGFRPHGDEFAVAVPTGRGDEIGARIKEAVPERAVGDTGLTAGLSYGVGSTVAEADAAMSTQKTESGQPRYRDRTTPVEAAPEVTADAAPEAAPEAGAQEPGVVSPTPPEGLSLTGPETGESLNPTEYNQRIREWQDGMAEEMRPYVGPQGGVIPLWSGEQVVISRNMDASDTKNPWRVTYLEEIDGELTPTRHTVHESLDQPSSNPNDPFDKGALVAAADHVNFRRRRAAGGDAEPTAATPESEAPAPEAAPEAPAEATEDVAAPEAASETTAAPQEAPAPTAAPVEPTSGEAGTTTAGGVSEGTSVQAVPITDGARKVLDSWMEPVQAAASEVEAQRAAGFPVDSADRYVSAVENFRQKVAEVLPKMPPGNRASVQNYLNENFPELTVAADERSGAESGEFRGTWRGTVEPTATAPAPAEAEPAAPAAPTIPEMVEKLIQARSAPMAMGRAGEESPLAKAGDQLMQHVNDIETFDGRVAAVREIIEAGDERAQAWAEAAFPEEYGPAIEDADTGVAEGVDPEENTAATEPPSDEVNPAVQAAMDALQNDPTISDAAKEKISRPEEGQGAPPGAPSRFGEITRADMVRAPERFQYKQLVNTKGVTAKLRGVEKVDQAFMGRLLVWYDAEDGTTYVVNGHHRHELADRAEYDGPISVYYIEAETAQEARTIGALSNMAEGQGTATDAAKVLRDLGFSEAQADNFFRDKGISTTDALVRDALYLRRLPPAIFQDVVTHRMAMSTGIALGQTGLNEASMLELRQEADQKNYTNEQIVQYGRIYGDAGEAEVETGDAMGTQLDMPGIESGPQNVSLRPDIVRLANSTRKHIRGSKTLFDQLKKERSQRILEEEDLGEVDTEKAGQRANEIQTMLGMFDNLSRPGRDLYTLFQEGARRIARGEDYGKVSGDTARAAVSTVREHIEQRGVGGTEIDGDDAQGPRDSTDPEQEGFGFGVEEPRRSYDLFGQTEGADPRQQDAFGAAPAEGTVEQTDAFQGSSGGRAGSVADAKATVSMLQGKVERGGASKTEEARYHQARSFLRVTEGRGLDAEELKRQREESGRPAEELDPDTIDMFGESGSVWESLQNDLFTAYGGEAEAKAAASDLYNAAPDVMEVITEMGWATHDRIEAVRRGEEVAAVSMDVKGMNLGTRVTGQVNTEALRQMLTVLRHPSSEHFQVIFLKESEGGDVVTRHEILSSGALDMAFVREEVVDEMLDAAAEAGEKLLIAHNHPSGDPKPSTDDRHVVKMWSDKAGVRGVDFVGQYVTNGDSVSFIPSGDVWATQTHEVDLTEGGRSWEIGRRTMSLTSGRDLARNLSVLPKDPDRIDVVYVNTQLRVVAVEPRSLGSVVDIDSWAPDMMGKLGARSIFLSADSDHAIDAAIGEMMALYSNDLHYVWSVVNSDGVDLRPEGRQHAPMGWRSGPNPFVPHARFSDASGFASFVREDPAGGFGEPTGFEALENAPESPPRPGPPPTETQRQAQNRLIRNRDRLAFLRDSMGESGSLEAHLQGDLFAGDGGFDAFESMIYQSLVPTQAQRVIDKAREAKTPAEGRRALRRAEKLLEREAKRRAIAELRSTVAGTNFKKMHPTQRKAAEAAIKDIDLSGTSSEALRHLRATSKYLEANPENNTIPPEVLAKMKVLDLKRLRELSTGEIRSMNDAVTLQAHLNRTKNELRGQRRHEQITQHAQSVVREIRSSGASVGRTEDPGQRQEGAPKASMAKYFLREFSVRPEVMLEHYAPTLQDLFFEGVVVRGQAQALSYKNGFQRVLQNAVKEAGFEWHTAKLEDWRTEVVMQVESTDGKSMDLTRDERIWLATTLRDPSNRALAKRNGMTLGRNRRSFDLNETTIKEILEGVTDKEAIISNAMFRTFNGSMKEAINSAWVEVYGYEIADVDQYVPRSIFEDSVDTGKDALAAFALNRSPTITSWGHLRDRLKSHGARLEIGGAFDAFSLHADNIARISGYLIPAKNLMSVMGTVEVKQEMDRKLGERFRETMEKALDIQVVPIPARDQADSFVRHRMGMFGASVLGLRLSTLLLNPSGLFVSASYQDNGFANLARAIPGAKKDWNRVQEMAKKHSPYWVERYDNFFHQVTSGMATQRGRGYGKAPVSEIGLQPLQWSDKVGAVIRWRMAEMHVRDTQPELNEDSDAFGNEVAREWERLMYRGENTSHGGDMTGALAMGRTNTLMGTLVMFTSSVSKIYSVGARAYLQAERGDTNGSLKSAVGMLGATLWAAAVREVIFGARGGDEDDDKGVLEAFGKRAITESVGYIPILGGAVVKGMVNKLMGEDYYGFSASVVDGYFADALKAVESIIDAGQAALTQELDARGELVAPQEAMQAIDRSLELAANWYGFPYGGPKDALNMGLNLANSVFPDMKKKDRLEIARGLRDDQESTDLGPARRWLMRGVSEGDPDAVRRGLEMWQRDEGVEKVDASAFLTWIRQTYGAFSRYAPGEPDREGLDDRQREEVDRMLRERDTLLEDARRMISRHSDIANFGTTEGGGPTRRQRTTRPQRRQRP